MISYEPLRKTMKSRNISSYTLINKAGFSGNTLQRIKDNKPMSTTTIDKLCKVLKCGVTDIIEYIED